MYFDRYVSIRFPATSKGYLGKLTAFEAGLVPLEAASQLLFRGVDRLVAFGALGNFHRFERHGYEVLATSCKRTE